MSTMTFRGITGTIGQDEDGEWFGKLCGIDDLVMYAGRDRDHLVDKFAMAVLDYQHTRRALDKSEGVG